MIKIILNFFSDFLQNYLFFNKYKQKLKNNNTIMKWNKYENNTLTTIKKALQKITCISWFL